MRHSSKQWGCHPASAVRSVAGLGRIELPVPGSGRWRPTHGIQFVRAIEKEMRAWLATLDEDAIAATHSCARTRGERWEYAP